jgi:hypothetical protein
MPTYSFRRTSACHRSLTLTVSLLALSVVASAASAQKQPVKRTPLTSVEAVTDIDAPKDPDDPGTGGGMDASNYFSRKLAAKLNDCTAQIRSTTDAWVRASQLHVVKVEDQPGDLMIHATRSDLEGFFEIIYRVKLQQERARVTVFFYAPDGAQLEPATIDRLLKDYKIDEFQDKLTHALLCGGN